MCCKRSPNNLPQSDLLHLVLTGIVHKMSRPLLNSGPWRWILRPHFAQLPSAPPRYFELLIQWSSGSPANRPSGLLEIWSFPASHDAASCRKATGAAGHSLSLDDPSSQGYGKRTEICRAHEGYRVASHTSSPLKTSQIYFPV